MPVQPTVSVRIARMILAAAAAEGASADAVARAAGLAPETLADADARIPLAVEDRLWDEAAQQTGDPLFGLHAGHAYRPGGGLDVFDYVCRAAPDLRGAVQRVIRYNRLLHDVAIYGLHETGATAVISHAFRAGLPGPSPHAADCTFAAAMGLARHWTGREIRARRVALPRPAPADPLPWQTIAGTADVRFGAPRIEIELDRAALDLPLVTADAGLCAVLERHADALLAALPEPGGIEARVREAIAARLKHGTPAAAAIAAQLHMSVRTLHRRLAEAGTSFGEELDAIRRGLALRYLGDARVSIAEVAFLLGYSEPRAFHRAFKAWTGQTPGAFRQAPRS